MTLATVPLFVLSLMLINAQGVTSLTNERDAKALDLLLVTDVSAKEFVFGKLGVKGGGSVGAETIGFIFAFQVLPTIIFIAALFAVLYYLGVMTVIVRAFAKVMTRLMGASGAESLNVAASVFMGQTEAPLRGGQGKGCTWRSMWARCSFRFWP